VHLVTHGHFRSRDKDGGNAIQFAVAENPMLYANFMALCLIEMELWVSKVCGNMGFFFTVFAPVTLTLTQ